MASFKLAGKIANQIERGEAIANFRAGWLPRITPGFVDQSWSEYLDDLHDLGWISDWQLKNWATPELGVV